MIERINSLPDFGSTFNDSRIDKRADDFIRTFISSRKATISKLSKSSAEQKAYYRLLENTKFSEDLIKERTFSKCNHNSANRHVLAINDTVDFNLDSHKGRVDLENGFGLSSNATMGFKLHSSLIIDAHSHFPIGFSSVDIWNRPAEQALKNERRYKASDIGDKESNKWIRAIDDTVSNISRADAITFVADREADVYDVLARKRDGNVHFVIRSKSDRRLGSGLKLRTFLSNAEERFGYEIQIEGDIRKKSRTRKARLSVKYERVTLVKPQSCNDGALPDSTTVYVIEVAERTESNKKVHWVLYTTHPVNTDTEAMQVILWYRARWNIEQVHRLLKTEGLEIERTQLEKAGSIRKLIILALTATLRVMQMHLAYSRESEQDIEIGFDRSERDFLKVLNTRVEGETAKLRNPFEQNKLRWATWIIARLGGWKGYQTQRAPGVITLQKGLVKFYHMLDGWLMAKDTYG